MYFYVILKLGKSYGMAAVLQEPAIWKTDYDGHKSV